MEDARIPPESASKNPSGSQSKSPPGSGPTSPPGQASADGPGGLLPAEHWAQLEPVQDDNESVVTSLTFYLQPRSPLAS